MSAASTRSTCDALTPTQLWAGYKVVREWRGLVPLVVFPILWAQHARATYPLQYANQGPLTGTVKRPVKPKSAGASVASSIFSRLVLRRCVLNRVRCCFWLRSYTGCLWSADRAPALPHPVAHRLHGYIQASIFGALMDTFANMCVWFSPCIFAPQWCGAFGCGHTGCSISQECRICRAVRAVTVSPRSCRGRGPSLNFSCSQNALTCVCCPASSAYQPPGAGSGQPQRPHTAVRACGE